MLRPAVLTFVCYLGSNFNGVLLAQPNLRAPLAEVLPARAGTGRVSAEWLLSHLPTTFDPGPQRLAWMPDGRTLIYTIFDERYSPDFRIELLDIATGSRRELGRGLSPVVSPDGRQLAFARTEAGITQLWVMSSDGTSAHQITQFAGGLGRLPRFQPVYAWSLDSRELAIAYRPEFKSSAFRAAGSDTTQPSGVELGSSPPTLTNGELWRVEVASGAMQRILSIPYDMRDLSWLPGGAEIVFTANRTWFENADRKGVGQVWAVRVSGGVTRVVANTIGFQQLLRPAVSHDGRHVAFIYDPSNPVYPIVWSLGIAPTTGDAPSIVQLTTQLKLVDPVWSVDGKSLYVKRTYGGYSQVYRIDAVTGAATRLTEGALNVRTHAISPNGQRLAWVGADAHGRFVLRVADVKRGADNELGPTRDVIVITPGLRPGEVMPALSEVREIEWSSKDGLSLRGLLVLPLEFNSGARYPLIVDIHGGGPSSRISLSGALLSTTPLEWQVWAAKGYAVLIPDYRSTGAYGLTPVLDWFERHDISDREFEDVMGAIDYVVAQGIADSTRLAVMGFSAGAYRVNSAITKTRRFRAAVSNEGWADEYMSAGVGANAGGNPNTTYFFGGYPWDVPERYFLTSPIYHTKGVTTPTLFLMGDPTKGSVDYMHSVQFLYTALKLQGVDTKYVRYPDEGHGLKRPVNQRDALQRAIQWIDAHIN
jgi:dipeptidyl aminopeptidase/acylaminoacyl peptidase